MSMLRALATLGAGAAAGFKGYQQGLEEKRKREQEDEDRAWQKEQRDRQRKEWSDADAEKQKLANAAADVTPTEVKSEKPETMDNRDVGLPGEQVLPTAGYDVQGKRYSDLAQANEAAAAQNTEEARSNRMAQALEARSPERAAQMRAATRQGKAADLSIAEATQRQADAKWERDLSSVKDENELADFLSKSHGDMQGGKVKMTAVRSADGKTFTFNKVNEDGSTTPASPAFASIDEARMALSKRVTAEQRLAHYEGIRRYNETLQLHKDEAAARRQHEARMEGLMRKQIEMRSAAGAGADGQPLMPDATFDIKTATAEAQARIKGMRDERAAAGKPMTAQEEAIELQNTIAAYRQVHTQRFIQSAINGALTKAKGDPQAYASEYQTALSMGATPQALAAMGHLAPAGIAPAQVVATPQAANPAAPTAPQQTPQTATRMATVAADPLAGLSRQQIREKRSELLKERSRWAKDPNGTGLVNDIDTLIQRIDNGQY